MYIELYLSPAFHCGRNAAFPRAETSLAQKHIEPFPLKRFHSRVSARGKKLRYNIGVSARKCKTRAIFCKHQLKWDHFAFVNTWKIKMDAQIVKYRSRNARWKSFHGNARVWYWPCSFYYAGVSASVSAAMESGTKEFRCEVKSLTWPHLTSPITSPHLTSPHLQVATSGHKWLQVVKWFMWLSGFMWLSDSMWLSGKKWRKWKKWRKVVKSGEKWRKVAKSGEKCEKWQKVGKSGEKWEKWGKKGEKVG